LGGLSLASRRQLTVPTLRHRREFAPQITPLLLLGVGLVLSNPLVTIIEDESKFLNFVTQPVRETLARYFSGEAPEAHPPLYDILMHFWLRATGGNFDLLRIPSILFFLAGLFLLGRASRHLTGKSGGFAVVWAAVLWPFGFHFGRLATWHAFAFFLVSGLTLAYLNYLEKRTTANWVALLFFAAGLLWTSYFGWAILACLAIDLFLRSRSGTESPSRRIVIGTAAVLIAVSLPFSSAIRSTLRSYMDVPHGVLAFVTNSAFTVYSLFASESVAPWYWRYSIPVGLAILACLAIVVWWTPSATRRFLIYSAFLIVLLGVLGVLTAERVFMICPWILLPVGVAIETAKPRWANLTLAVGLLAIGGIGWYGISARRYYFAPRFIEPWKEVAEDVASKIREGATVISDHRSFLFYLTYDLQVPKTSGEWKFKGTVGDRVKDPRVYYSADWLAAGRPIGRKMILVRGGDEPGGRKLFDDVVSQLGQQCSSISSRLRMRDEGYAWKQRFYPELGEPLWRIEIREYDCEPSGSKQIYPIPPK
jgi:hypothetical protein